MQCSPGKLAEEQQVDSGGRETWSRWGVAAPAFCPETQAQAPPRQAVWMLKFGESKEKTNHISVFTGFFPALKDSFAGYRILGWQSLSFRFWTCYPFAFWLPRFQLLILVRFLCVWQIISLASFRDVSWYLPSHHSVMVCLGANLFEVIILGVNWTFYMYGVFH